MSSFWKGVGRFFTGSPEKRKNVSTLRPEQEDLYQQLQNASMNPGAGGAFGDAADYYRDLLSNDSQTMNQLSAPEMRRFNEDVIPGLSEQFAGMGSGGLDSSGFRNAAVNAGTDLSERLGALRAGLRSQGAQGLSNLGQQGLGSYSQNMVTQQGSPGFLSQISPLAGQVASAYLGTPGAFGGESVGKNSSPYGNQPMGGAPPSSSNGFNLPKFGAR